MEYSSKSDETLKIMASAYMDRNRSLPVELQEEINKRFVEGYNVDEYTPSRDGFVQSVYLLNSYCKITTTKNKVYIIDWTNDLARKQFMMGIDGNTVFSDRRIASMSA